MEDNDSMSVEGRDRPQAEPEANRGNLVEAALLSASLSDYSGLLGCQPHFVPPPEPAPAIQVLQWYWSDPVSAILHFAGWTLEDIASSPRAVAEFTQLWRLWEDSQQLKAAREKENQLEEALWFRRQGCFASCPLCGALQACDCPESTV